MKIHAIQTGTVMIKHDQQVGRGKGAMRMLNLLRDDAWTEPLPIYAWAIEHPEGVIVVDTGETARTTEPGYFPSWHPYYRRAVAMDVQPEQEIGPQLERLGIRPQDVRWVVMTHLHTDHAGGLHHFSKSKIMVVPEAHRQASGLMGKLRGFLPHRWPAWFAPAPIELQPMPVGPFGESMALTEAGDVLIVPTPGHTPHHVSVVVQGDDLSYFLAGDSSYSQNALLAGQVDGVAPSESVAAGTLERIQQFVRGTSTVYLPSHDPQSALRLVRRQIVPAAPAASSSRPPAYA